MKSKTYLVSTRQIGSVPKEVNVLVTHEVNESSEHRLVFFADGKGFDGTSTLTSPWVPWRSVAELEIAGTSILGFTEYYFGEDRVFRGRSLSEFK